MFLAGRLLPLLFVLLVSCATPPGPQETATQFWHALIAGESDALRALVRDADKDHLDGGRTVLPVRGFSLGRMVVEGQRADIETRLDIGGDTPMNLDITTVLLREGDAWRVDYAASVREISRDSELAKMLEQLQQLASRAGTGLNRSLEELKNALPRLEDELSNIEKDVRARLPELRKRLEELGEQLRQPAPDSGASSDHRKSI